MRLSSDGPWHSRVQRRDGVELRASTARSLTERVRFTQASEEKFLRRVREELAPAVERIRDKILEAHAEAPDFITRGYPQALQQGAMEEERNRGVR
jgi:hypothetical protein